MIKMDGCQEASFQRSENDLIIQEISGGADRLNRITQLSHRLDREKTLILSVSIERGLKYLKYPGIKEIKGWAGCHLCSVLAAEAREPIS